MTQFRYQGPVSSVKLQSGPKAQLVPGKLVELPGSDPYVVTLVARGHLTEVVEETKAVKETKASSNKDGK